MVENLKQYSRCLSLSSIDGWAVSDRDQILELAAIVDALAGRHLAIALRVAAGSDVGATLAGALWVLGRSAAEPTMRQVAADLRCDPSNATLLIRQLEARGLAGRFPDSADGRRRVVRLTAEGLALTRSMADAVVAESPFARLTTDQRSGLDDTLRAAESAARSGSDVPAE
jgi:DNA-binding MarR family transcriptional regulator